jgi:L-threonylcarbamoyladenylate synthase
MLTEYYGPVTDKELKTSKHMESAARRIQQGGIVAFPTETTYGLGGSILNEEALSRLYDVKKRDRSQSLPVLVANESQLKFVAAPLCHEASLLVQEFLPGPLTLVVKKHPNLSRQITGDKETVAVRIPSAPMTLRLIELTGCPLAVTSANLSGKPSATKASHVIEDLNGKIDGVIDGGETEFGMESTILSLEDPKRPRLLRFGLISKESLEKKLGRPVVVHPLALACNLGLPNMRTAVRLFSSLEQLKIYLKLSSKSKRLILSTEKNKVSGVDHFTLNKNNLYEGLRTADRGGYAEALVVCSLELKKNALLLNRLKQIAKT